MTDRTPPADGSSERRITVPFAGEGAGSGPLSWGQRVLWGAMRWQQTWMPVGFVQPLPAGTTVDDVVDDLRFVMCHYPSMRTRLRIDPHHPTQPTQVVAASGEVTLAVVDAGPHDDPAQVAGEVEQRYRNTDYDFQNEWPVRMAVVRHRGEPTHLVWVMCHLVTDAFGAGIMLSELAARDASGSTAAWSPLDQARWQHSPAGQRHGRSALRYWERHLRSVPARRFPVPADRPSPRFWHGSFTSRAAHLAVQAVAARTGGDDAPVLLAAFVSALAQVTGVDPVMVRVIASNRFRPGLADGVAPVSQPGLLVVDAAGKSFDEVFDQARRRAVAAYKYAYYDPEEMDALVVQVSEERGETVDIGCLFNDRRLQRTGPSEESAPTSEEIRAALPETRFEWHGQQDDKPYEHLLAEVDDTPDTMTVTVYVDTHYVAPADVEACLRAMADMTVAAATGEHRDPPSDALGLRANVESSHGQYT